MSKLMTGVGFCLLIVAAACQPPGTEYEPPPDYAAQLAPKFNAFIEVWNNKNYAALDEMAIPEFRRLAPDQSVYGLDNMKAFLAQVHTTYPDFNVAINEAYYVEDLAIAAWTVTGTNTGEGAFPPTGKAIRVSGMTMLRFVNGKIREEVVFYDTAAVTSQLGIEALPHVSQ